MLYATPFITAYTLIATAILGLCMGSFLNCFAWRVVHGESVLKGRSHCDACGHVLSPRDLIPVVSFLASHGRCRYCGVKLSKGHLWAEIATAASYLAIVSKYDISLQALEYLLFVSVLLACAFADLEGYMIPDRCILFGIVLRPVFLLLSRAPLSAWLDSLLGGFLVAGGLLLVVLLYEKVKKVEAMGGGDIKLLFVTGLFLGWKLNLLCLLAACVLGIAFGLLAPKKDGAPLFPWGPAITAAALLTVMYGQGVLDWYMGLF